jgi:hypothetical protein
MLLQCRSEFASEPSFRTFRFEELTLPRCRYRFSVGRKAYWPAASERGASQIALPVRIRAVLAIHCAASWAS